MIILTTNEPRGHGEFRGRSQRNGIKVIGHDGGRPEETKFIGFFPTSRSSDCGLEVFLKIFTSRGVYCACVTLEMSAEKKRYCSPIGRTLFIDIFTELLFAMVIEYYVAVFN